VDILSHPQCPWGVSSAPAAYLACLTLLTYHWNVFFMTASSYVDPPAPPRRAPAQFTCHSTAPFHLPRAGLPYCLLLPHILAVRSLSGCSDAANSTSATGFIATHALFTAPTPRAYLPVYWPGAAPAYPIYRPNTAFCVSLVAPSSVATYHAFSRRAFLRRASPPVFLV